MTRRMREPAELPGRLARPEEEEEAGEERVPAVVDGVWGPGWLLVGARSGGDGYPTGFTGSGWLLGEGDDQCLD